MTYFAWPRGMRPGGFFSAFDLRGTLSLSPLMGVPEVFDQGGGAAHGELRMADGEPFVVVRLAVPGAVGVAQLRYSPLRCCLGY